MKAWILFLLLLVGCSSVPKGTALSSPSSDLPERGIVLGEMIMFDNGLNWGVGISLKDVKTGKEYDLKGAKKFFLKLPPGDYQLYRIAGMNRSKKPLDDSNAIQFTVKQGEVQYIGSFIENYVANMKIYETYRKRDKALSAHDYIGYASIGIKEWTYSSDMCTIFVVDNFEEVQKEFTTQYPEFLNVSIVRPSSASAAASHEK